MEFAGLGFADFDFADFGLLAFGPADLVFEDLSFEDLDCGIAVARRGAITRFAAFRPRLTILVPIPGKKLSQFNRGRIAVFPSREEGYAGVRIFLCI